MKNPKNYIWYKLDEGTKPYNWMNILSINEHCIDNTQINEADLLVVGKIAT
jgi:hypothetical protein